MKLYIKQRVFSWSDTYDVYDEREEAKYFVKAEIFSLGHQIHVYGKNENEIGAMHQKLLTLTPEFYVEIKNRQAGTIKKKLSLLRPKYEIDYNGWKIEGDYMGWNYKVLLQDTPVMTITKELFHWGDTYVIDFQNPEDEIPGLLLVIAIDAANCSNR